MKQTLGLKWMVVVMFFIPGPVAWAGDDYSNKRNEIRNLARQLEDLTDDLWEIATKRCDSQRYHQVIDTIEDFEHETDRFYDKVKSSKIKFSKLEDRFYNVKWNFGRVESVIHSLRTRDNLLKVFHRIDKTIRRLDRFFHHDDRSGNYYPNPSRDLRTRARNIEDLTDQILKRARLDRERSHHRREQMHRGIERIDSLESATDSFYKTVQNDPHDGLKLNRKLNEIIKRYDRAQHEIANFSHPLRNDFIRLGRQIDLVARGNFHYDAPRWDDRRFDGPGHDIRKHRATKGRRDRPAWQAGDSRVIPGPSHRKRHRFIGRLPAVGQPAHPVARQH